MKAANLIIKPVSGSCNLACRYCVYRDAEGASTLISDETLECVIRRAMEESEERCRFSFQGGEPTLAGLAFYEKVVALQQQYNTRDLQIMNTIQTNGYALDEDWAAFLAANNFLVSISLDGSREAQDALRVDSEGRGSYTAVERTIQMLIRHRIPYNILCVVTAPVARHPEQVYRNAQKNGWQYLQFIPVLPQPGEPAQPWALTPERYGNFLCKIFDLWCIDVPQRRAPSIRQFDNWLRMLCHLPSESCAMRGFCQINYVVEADGSVYPCEHYVSDEWCLGSILEDSLEALAQSPVAQQFEQSADPLSDDCRVCPFAPVCRCGCRRERLLNEHGLAINAYCEAYRQFFPYALPRLYELANHMSQGLDPRKLALDAMAQEASSMQH